ncbi:zinc finger protein 664 isoform X2 [Apis mellifera]|uniref:Zinc finger protein 664 isoform X2 n=1 Tax=Apis mellifera TaxID=7460 RepID=A0A7M7GUK5_APIME|nr:zinc finger protein 664 isoform X2 [Apis mellifera]|eukprot:XP_006562778.1 zinc finger protein 664 isoform X2 [Apis mellifera]
MKIKKLKKPDLGNVDWDVKSEASSERTIEVLESELEPLPSPPDPHAYCELSCEDPPPPRPSIDTTTTAPPTNACRPVDTGDVHGRNTGMRKIGTRWRGFEDDEECRKRYTCSVCELEFAKHRDYKRHMVKHSDARPYICSTCGKAFKRSSEICNHRRIHRDIKYTCEICGFTTNNKISLRMHHRRVHERDYRYRCDQCDKGFMSNYDLEDHKTSHLETKAFICEFCGNGYSQRSYLVSHKRVMHGIKMSTPKAFQCNICNKRSFATEQELRSHLNLHSQMFLCAECGQKFATNYALKLHCRRHTGEKPYQCPFCPKAFARSPALRVHKLTHTGERPYVCNICGQSFTQRSSLMVHHKKHPGNHPPPPPLPLTRLAKEKS